MNKITVWLMFSIFVISVITNWMMVITFIALIGTLWNLLSEEDYIEPADIYYDTEEKPTLETRRVKWKK